MGMKISGRYTSPFFARCQAHDCPRCSHHLTLVERAAILDRDSPDASRFPSGLFQDIRPSDRVLFIWDEFECEKCKLRISVSQLRRLYKMREKTPVRILTGVGFFYAHCKRHRCPRCGKPLRFAYDVKRANAPPFGWVHSPREWTDALFAGEIEWRICLFMCKACGYRKHASEFRNMEKTGITIVP